MASAQHRTTWPNNVGRMLEQMLGPFEQAFTWSENLLQMFIFFFWPKMVECYFYTPVCYSVRDREKVKNQNQNIPMKINSNNEFMV